MDLTTDELMRAANDPSYLFRPRPERDQSLPPLAPQEEESLLGQLGHRAVGGLSYVGKSLGKAFGGRAIRGLLGGHPRELASIVPFSDTLGITDEADEVSGEQLLKNAGVLQGEGTKGSFEARDLAGPALELALDPGTFITGLGKGATTELGKAASQLSILPRTFAERAKGFAASTPAAAALAAKTGATSVADVAGKPLGGLLRMGLPFSDSGMVLGTGDLGQRLGSRLDTLAQGALYSRPGRAVAALLDKDVNGVYGAEAQKAARQANDELRVANASVYGEKLKLARDLDQAKLLQDPKTLRATFEGQASAVPGSALSQIRGGVRQRLDRALTEENALGVPTGKLADNLEPVATDYFPSYRATLPTDRRGFESSRRQPFSAANPSMEAREDFLKNVPGGRNQVEAMVNDPALRGGTPLDAAFKIRTGYLNHDEQEWLRLLQSAPQRKAAIDQLKALPPTQVTPAHTAQLAQLEAEDATLGVFRRKFDQSHQLANWVRGLDPEAYIKEQRPFFQHPLEDYGQRLLYGARSQTFAKAIHDTLAENAVSPYFGHQVPQGAVPISQVLKDAGLTFNMQSQATGKMVGAEATQMDKLAKQVLPGPWANLSLHLPPGANPLDHVYVPGDLAKDMTKFTKSYNAPEALEPFLHVLDSVTNLTKSAQTSLWPAYYARNLVQGAYMNWSLGLGDPAYHELNPMRYLRPYLDAKSLREGRAIEGAAAMPLFKGQGLTDEAATQKVADLMYSWLPNRRYDAKTVEWETGIGQVGGAHQFHLPGEQEPGLGEILKGAVPRSKAEANPLNITGVGGANETRFAPVRAGSQVNQMLDDLNQGAAFIGALKQGYEPQAAAERTIGAHYDYSHLSQFERSVVRRVLPFYGFMRQNLPAVVQELATHPGGKTASLVKTASALRPGQGDFVPDYIREGGLALPVGGREDGTQRFLTHFDLPPEAAFDPFATGPGGPARTMMGILGQTNPLLKGPLEYATGKQFYSGRDLADLQGPTGNTLADQVIMNSPLSRFYTTGRTLLDERKGLGAKAVNLVSPAKVTDVDLEKAKAGEGKKIAEELLKGQEGVKQFSNLYVKPEDVQKLTPEQVLLMRLYKTEEARQQKAAKTQKKKAA